MPFGRDHRKALHAMQHLCRIQHNHCRRAHGVVQPFESMLLVEPNQPWGPIGCYVEPTEAVESSGRNPPSRMEECSNAASLEGLFATSIGAIRATDSNTWRAFFSIFYSRIDRAVRLRSTERPHHSSFPSSSYVSIIDTFHPSACSRSLL